MARFTLPRDIYFGEGAIEELKNLKGKKKAVIVTGGGSMKKNGFLQKCEMCLKNAGLSTVLIEGVEPDPSIETVLNGAQKMREANPDVIVAIGGGSAIDAAKAMWVFYEYPDKKFEDILIPFSFPTLRKKAIFVAIPSTSGTASEVTAFSVITDYKSKIKYPLADFEITPDIAILDTDIPLTMPDELAAFTGMDAITHAVEAYTASNASAFSDPLALRAIQDVYENLEESVKGGRKARAVVHIAQCLAGMAFSNALLGIVHSLAHKTGAEFELPHGLCNAVMLPYVIEYNAKECAQKYAQIARSLGLCGYTDKQLVNALADAFRNLNEKVGIKNSFQQYGITEQHLLSKIDYICQHALEDPCTASNPRKVDFDALRKIFSCAYYGLKVVF